MADAKRQVPTHIVAVGASAGGLAALEALFSAMPEKTGAAFVIIQHLAPDHKSLMTELLARRTKISVSTVVDDEAVVADHIYVIDPEHNLDIVGDRLRYSKRDLAKPLNLPIDQFFKSLARDQEYRACAVVLSGTGSDGTVGARAIRDAGGLVIVQDPEEAKFDGMPRSVIGAGASDITLRVAAIPEKIVRYMKFSGQRAKSLFSKPDDPEAVFDGENAKLLESIFTILEAQCGIDFSRYKSSTVARRIQRRVAINQYAELGDYFAFLSSSQQEQEILSSELLINVTQFFRDKDSFEMLAKDVLAPLFADSDSVEDVRIWIPGCSTGEEAYTMAMLCLEARQKQGSSRRARIFATDVDVQVIADATTGTYPIGAMTDVPEELQRKYFSVNHDGTLTVTATLRQMVVFAVHDLTKDPPFSSMDLVSCRNMLIYLRHEAQQQAISHLVYACKKDGHLFLGPSENLGGAKGQFRPVHARQRIYCKVHHSRSGSGFSPQALSKNKARQVELPSVSDLMKRRARAKTASPSSVTVSHLVDRFGPPSVLISCEGEAQHAFGGIEAYFRKPERGEVSRSLADMVLPELRTPITNLVAGIVDPGGEAIYSGISVTLDGKERNIELHLSLLPDIPEEDTRYVVSFVENNPIKSRAAVKPMSYDERAMAEKRVANLESDLKQAQQHLQVTVEELESTNEELQSSNEELLAANEELQSTNEELQSVNEEMHTVNFEYQEKIDELTQVNALLDGVLQTTAAGMVYLDNEMMVRKYTSQVRDFIHLTETDVGRIFSHIRHRLDYPDFDADLRRARDARDATQRQVRSEDGRDVMVTINAYEDASKRSGMVISVLDITEQVAQRRVLESAESELAKASQIAKREERLQMALEAGRIGTWRWDKTTEVLSGDSRARKIISTRDGVFPRNLSELRESVIDVDVERVSRLFRMQADQEVVNVELRLPVQDGGERVVHLAASPEFGDDQEVRAVHGICMDVSPRRVVKELLEVGSQGSQMQLRCLYIEDDEDDVELLRDTVADLPKNRQPEIVHAKDLEEAGRLLVTQDFEVVILDLSLPETVGLDSVVALREMAPALPLVVMTGATDDAIAGQAIDLGAQDFIRKQDLQPRLFDKTIRFAHSRHVVTTRLAQLV